MLEILGQLLPTLVSGLLTVVAGWVTTWMAAKNNQQVGATVEAAQVTTQTVKVVTAEAQAEAAAPRTLDDVIARLKAGTA